MVMVKQRGNLWREIQIGKIFWIVNCTLPNITLSSNSRPVRVIKFVSEESIEEGIYTIALEKLRLEQDLTNEEDGDDGMYHYNMYN